jgi:hypothetical protein
MRLAIRLTAVALLACTPGPVIAQQGQPPGVAGHWIGTMTSADGAESPFTLTNVRDGDGDAGVTSGLSETGEVTMVGARMTGIATVSVGSQRQTASLALHRRNRRDVPQPQVQQRINYFAGRWTFDYLGGDVAFSISEESSVDGGPFRRLGSARFTRVQ